MPLNAERKAGKIQILIFILFSLTRTGTESKSNVSAADTLSTITSSGLKTKPVHHFILRGFFLSALASVVAFFLKFFVGKLIRLKFNEGGSFKV